MNDKIKEILDKWKCYIGLTKKFSNNDMELLRVEDIERVLDYITNLQQENERLEENNQAMQEEMARVWEENERLKKIRNEAICYNKELCKIYDCGMELSNAQTNLCILEDTEL